jgi:hypothetical protein
MNLSQITFSGSAKAARSLEIADDRRNDWIVREDGGNSEPIVTHDNIKRSQIRIKAQWLLSKALPKTYGDYFEPNAQPGRDTLAEVLREIDGRTRGLPSAGPWLPKDEAERAGGATNWSETFKFVIARSP